MDCLFENANVFMYFGLASTLKRSKTENCYKQCFENENRSLSTVERPFKIDFRKRWCHNYLFIASSTDITAWERHVIVMNFVFDGLLWTGSHIVKWLNLGFHRQREKESFLFSRPMNSTLNISRVWDRIHFPLFNVGDIINIAFHVTHSVAKNEQITNFKNFHSWKKGSAGSS